jgi:hypothetical protein
VAGGYFFLSMEEHSNNNKSKGSNAKYLVSPLSSTHIAQACSRDLTRVLRELERSLEISRDLTAISREVVRSSQAGSAKKIIKRNHIYV